MGYKKYAQYFILSLSLVFSGCATRIDPFSNTPITDGYAVGLLIVDSEVEIASLANSVLGTNVYSYPIDGTKSVMAYRLLVGSSFKVNRVQTLDGRYANLPEVNFKIEKSGIYYLGTLMSNQRSVLLVNRPVDVYLNLAKRKYAQLLANLQPVNFAWPKQNPLQADPTISYANSNAIQQWLAKAVGRGLNIGEIQPVHAFHSKCGVLEQRKIDAPDFLSFEDYIRLSLISELKASAKLDPKGEMITGKITELEFSIATGSAHWLIGLEFSIGNQPLAYVQSKYPVKTSAFIACRQIEEAFPAAVQNALEEALKTPGFMSYLGK
ncbi:MAG TPA: hypothetical protein VN030_11865 [Cellvibrio sp.]|nr:hypothetical protein [Cellvibrio sp.]